MKFTIYDSLSGRVLFGGDAHEPALMVQVGQSILEGKVYDSGWVVNGTHFILPAQPSPEHIFDYAAKQWVDPRTLADMKLARNEYVNQSRLSANQTSFSYAGKQIAVDPLSRSDIDAVHGIVVLTNEMPDDWVGFWKATDNTYVPVSDVTAWTTFYTAMVAQGSTNFAHSQALKAQLAAATTIEEVEAVVW